MTNTAKNWKKELVIYQIYPRSFRDANGDGIGDLRGVIEKLDYITELGANAIWMTPVFSSPNHDNGYDVSDYESILEEYGSLEDFQNLIAECHKRNIRIIMDLVINHSSDEHSWFIASKASRGNPKSDYYIWKNPSPNGGPPNNWESAFGGSAWEFVKERGQYYLHLFSRKQPDLNWECKALREEIINIIERWVKKGVDGFRLDAISYLQKPGSFPDSTKPSTSKEGFVLDMEITANLPETHIYLQELNCRVFHLYDSFTVGEVACINAETAKDYVLQSRREFDMIIPFVPPIVEVSNWNVQNIKKETAAWYSALKDGGWWARFFSNHDKPRQVSLYGNDKEFYEESAKLLATILHTLPGTPFIFQGEEIGMTNLYLNSIDEYDDIDTKSMYHKLIDSSMSSEEALQFVSQLSRDNARTPMQWDDSENGGFTVGKPWLQVNPNHNTINVKEQLQREDSILNYYKKLIQMRKENEIMVYGDYRPILMEQPEIFAYLRQLDGLRWVVVHNFSRNLNFINLNDFLSEKAELILCNTKTSPHNLKQFTLVPYQSIIIEDRIEN